MTLCSAVAEIFLPYFRLLDEYFCGVAKLQNGLSFAANSLVLAAQTPSSDAECVALTRAGEVKAGARRKRFWSGHRAASAHGGGAWMQAARGGSIQVQYVWGRRVFVGVACWTA